VTHIVCSNLPDTKLKALAAAARGGPSTPIVRPEWVTASLAAGRLLPARDFPLDALRGAPGQRGMAAFARPAGGASGAGTAGTALPAPGPLQPREASGAQPIVLEEAEEEGWEEEEEGMEALGSGDDAAGDGSLPPSPGWPQGAPPAQRAAAPSAAAPSPSGAAGPSPSSAAAEQRRAEELAARLRSESELLRGPPRSTRDDPNFVDNFFKASRLHFIGAR